MSHRNSFYYDQASNVTCVRDDDLGLTYYTYDLLNRTTSLKNPFGEGPSHKREGAYYEYLDCSQVGKRTLGNGCLTYYEYDVKGRVAKIDERESDMTQISELQYEYDKVGNPIKIEREDGSATYYAYDRTYQLTGETQVDDETQVEYDFAYEYDGAHSRTVKVAAGTPTYYTYNAANQMLTETTGAETTYYHYDGCGNTTAKQEPAGTTYYQYNTENLMTRIDFPDDTHSYYTYDADSKRVSQRTADGYSEFIYQGPDMLKLQMERDEAGDTKVQYTMGNGLEAMRRDAGSGIASGDSSFYHYSHLGTTVALTSAAESVTDTYRHDAWGVQLASTGTTVNPHTYVGQQRYYRMPNAGLYHLGFRDYAQGVGRFTTVDPVWDGVNWFVYVRNGPASASDATGLLRWCPRTQVESRWVWLGDHSIMQRRTDWELYYFCGSVLALPSFTTLHCEWNLVERTYWKGTIAKEQRTRSWCCELSLDPCKPLGACSWTAFGPWASVRGSKIVNPDFEKTLQTYSQLSTAYGFDGVDGPRFYAGTCTGPDGREVGLTCPVAQP